MTNASHQFPLRRATQFYYQITSRRPLPSVECAISVQYCFRTLNRAVEFRFHLFAYDNNLRHKPPGGATHRPTTDFHITTATRNVEALELMRWRWWQWWVTLTSFLVVVAVGIRSTGASFWLSSRAILVGRSLRFSVHDKSRLYSDMSCDFLTTSQDFAAYWNLCRIIIMECLINENWKTHLGLQQINHYHCRRWVILWSAVSTLCVVSHCSEIPTKIWLQGFCCFYVWNSLPTEIRQYIPVQE